MTLTVLALSSLYLIFLYKKTRKETDQKLQILDAKCNRLNTLLQNTSQNFERTEQDRLVEPGDVASHSIPDTESFTEENMNTLQALKEEYENFESSNQFEFTNEELSEIECEGKGESESQEKREGEGEGEGELLNESENDLSKELMEEIEALDTENNVNQNEEELTMLENLLNETEELDNVELETPETPTNETLENVENNTMKSTTTINYQDLTVKELKELAREKGLTVGGKKDELIDRLVSSSKQRTLSFE